MGAEVEVKLSRMRDPHIHRSSSGNVATLADLFLLVGTEEPRVMPLLHHNLRLLSHKDLAKKGEKYKCVSAASAAAKQ